ncbi:uncharacterized protein LOC117642390 isoform X4 [Thrips palmi]|uniref:Uncharacterized protein LOC117642390 isoform X3 n=1 Tax=Thrips palmi TaxID=161013 RepID=A0A6P8YQN2_THRPL|nr:uncharacterized protein LOC117642390 isoform X3 [Thrips palmi]XP_034236388.1 uncharacterized protein LOC117642390 isoform X4 [Thrips palmi]
MNMECYVCLEKFDIYSADRRPKVLPCGHTFCLRCLQGLQAKKCPLDNKVFTLQPDSLPDNFLVIQSCSNAAAAETAASRLWCRTCQRHATDDCVDGAHSVCSLKKARVEDARPLVEALQRGEAALDSLAGMMDASTRAVEESKWRATLKHDKAVMAAVRSSLQDAEKADTAIWEQARQAAARADKLRGASNLVKDPSTTCSLFVRSGAGARVVWRGDVDATFGPVKMLLCHLALRGELKQPVRKEQEQQGTVQQEMQQTEQQPLQQLLEENMQQRQLLTQQLRQLTQQPTQQLTQQATQRRILLIQPPSQQLTQQPTQHQPTQRQLTQQQLNQLGRVQQPPGQNLPNPTQQQPPPSTRQPVLQRPAGIVLNPRLLQQLRAVQEQPTQQEVVQPPPTLPKPANRPAVPRWLERANEGERELSEADMAARMDVGARVARGRDWVKGWTFDGTPPGPGTVTAKHQDSDVAVRWDNSITSAASCFSMGRYNKFHLRLLAPAPLKPHVGAEEGKDFFDVKSISPKSDEKMSKVLSGKSLQKIRFLVGLPCLTFITWSLKMLEQLSPHLEGLQMVSPMQRHLDVVLAMPRLQALTVTDVTAEVLRQVSQMASLRRLEVHCPLYAQLPVLAFPATPAKLQWLRCGVYPLVTALALVRVHADSLEELELVAASTAPYGCPDLAAELRGCGLKRLRSLVLLRETAYGAFCRHDKKTCSLQRQQLSRMFADSGVNVTVTCSFD